VHKPRTLAWAIVLVEDLGGVLAFSSSKIRFLLLTAFKL